MKNAGLEEQGLYRVVGVASKVTKLLTAGLDRRKSDKLNLEDGMEWESKTITSAVKTFFRNLPEPIMTFRLHFQFIAAAKLDSHEERVGEVERLVAQLPEPSKHMLGLLLQHLERVAARSDRNMMSVSNLGVCFGPTLLRAEEETVAAIMDIKFANVVVEILVENWRRLLPPDGAGGRVSKPRRQQQQQANAAPASSSPSHKLTVLPVSPGRGGFATSSSRSLGGGGGGLASPPQRPPPPYQNPPPVTHPTAPPPNPPAASGLPLPTGTVATLAHAVIYNNGPKQVAPPDLAITIRSHLSRTCVL